MMVRNIKLFLKNCCNNIQEYFLFDKGHTKRVDGDNERGRALGAFLIVAGFIYIKYLIEYFFRLTYLTWT